MIQNITILKYILNEKGIDINITHNHSKKTIDYSYNIEIIQLISKSSKGNAT